jgi:hypothetical protein
VHFEVLVIDKYRYGENIFPRDVKFCTRTGNPLTADQHLSLSLAGSRTGRSWCGVQPGQKIRMKYIPYGDKILCPGKSFSPKKFSHFNEKYRQMTKAAKHYF